MPYFNKKDYPLEALTVGFANLKKHYAKALGDSENEYAKKTLETAFARYNTMLSVTRKVAKAVKDAREKGTAVTADEVTAWKTALNDACDMARELVTDLKCPAIDSINAAAKVYVETMRGRTDEYLATAKDGKICNIASVENHKDLLDKTDKGSFEKNEIELTAKLKLNRNQIESTTGLFTGESEEFRDFRESVAKLDEELTKSHGMINERNVKTVAALAHNVEQYRERYKAIPGGGDLRRSRLAASEGTMSLIREINSIPEVAAARRELISESASHTPKQAENGVAELPIDM